MTRPSPRSRGASSTPTTPSASISSDRARGSAGSDSDYDLLVVVSDDVPPALRRSTRAYEALWGLSTSGDILVWTHTAFTERLHLRASLPSTVQREGRVLYSR